MSAYAEFVTRMRAKGVVRHELIGDLLCERVIKAAVKVDFRQLLVLGKRSSRPTALGG